MQIIIKTLFAYKLNRRCWSEWHIESVSKLWGIKRAEFALKQDRERRCKGPILKCERKIREVVAVEQLYRPRRSEGVSSRTLQETMLIPNLIADRSEPACWKGSGVNAETVKCQHED